MVYNKIKKSLNSDPRKTEWAHQHESTVESRQIDSSGIGEWIDLEICKDPQGLWCISKEHQTKE